MWAYGGRAGVHQASGYKLRHQGSEATPNGNVTDSTETKGAQWVYPVMLWR